MTKCKNCGQMMIEIGSLAGTIQIMDMEGKQYGERSPILYQCPEDKTIAID